VSGDWRFRNGYCRHNPRKMVRTWAEKEMRNLARLREAGIFAPEPRMLRAHVLVMDFIGEAGYPAPRLKARPRGWLKEPHPLTARRTRTCRPPSCASCTRSWWWTCAPCSRPAALCTPTSASTTSCTSRGGWRSSTCRRRARASLLSCPTRSPLPPQSVDLDHPRCFDFLREDLKHVNDFFSRKGVATATERELFDFVTDPAVGPHNMEACLDRLIAAADARAASGQGCAAPLAACWVAHACPRLAG